MKYLEYFFYETFTGGVFFLLFAVLSIIHTIFLNNPNSRYFTFIKGFAASIGFFVISIVLMCWRMSLFIDALFFKWSYD